MTAVVVADIIERASASFETAGRRAIRSFQVTGLSGTASGLILDAIGATGIPAVGDAHPQDADLYAVSVAGEMTGPSSALVQVEYRTPAPRERLKLGIDDFEISWRSATKIERTVYDVNGDPMYNHYAGDIWTYDLSTNERSATSGSTYHIHHAVFFDRPLPQAVLHVTAYRASISAADIAGLVGRVNDDTWYGGAAKTWLCLDVTADPDPDGGYYVTYLLQYDPATWRHTDRITDQAGQEPPDIASDNGIETWDVYETAEFDTLIGSPA
jgi:hypothetical protein